MNTKIKLKPTTDEKDGYYTFTTDKDFKVVQLSDVHIGAGFLSSKKDMMAVNAVEAMVKAEKPDLVVVTGDIGFPVPYQSGTLNNKKRRKDFCKSYGTNGRLLVPYIRQPRYGSLQLL